MFGLGVLVGRGTAPVQFDLDALQKQLAGIKQRVSEEEGQRFKIHLEKLKFFKNLKETGQDRPAPKKPGGGVSGPIPHKSVRVKKPARWSTARPVDRPGPDAADNPAAADRSAAPAAPGEPAAPGGTTLMIQVASSKDPEATRYLVDRLKKKGYPAFSALKEVPDKGTWYRIRVGPYGDRAAAEAAVARLKKEKFDAYVVKN
jgi:hypothetical protein